MVPNKSLDDIQIITALLHDVFETHGEVFNCKSRRLTLEKVNERRASEGVGFLTKTLPCLGKALERALSSNTPLDANLLGFDALEESKLPRFLGELFGLVLDSSGVPLQEPSALAIRSLMDILYCFYKYELPYTPELEQQVVAAFEETERDLLTNEKTLAAIGLQVSECIDRGDRVDSSTEPHAVARKARLLLQELFAYFDPTDIKPKHGPGAVATKQQLWDKYLWTNISAAITESYPQDAYFYASQGHVCDHLSAFGLVGEASLPARVILVPKDARGPRLISCEPVDNQWIQQGLSQAVVKLVEAHPLTKWNVFFTDQGPNQRGALLGSSTGKYVTLDLKEASDRVSLDLVRLLFPPHVVAPMEACRSTETTLPDGRRIKLKKFAPMGSSLCFPIMALTIWAILTAAAPDEDTRESILVYGDDVIGPTAFAEDAMKQLETFGLKINRSKSCTSGFYRESCGTNAFKGINVTPVRLRTVWNDSRTPEVYESWIAYANSYSGRGSDDIQFRRSYYNVSNLIAEALHAIYGAIPTMDMNLTCPSLYCVSHEQKPLKTRTSLRFQKKQYLVWELKSPVINQEMDGWSMLLRYFAEGTPSDYSYVIGPGATTCKAELWDFHERHFEAYNKYAVASIWKQPFRVRSYTRRRSSILVRRWR